MSINRATHCPACGQELPKKVGLICGLCDKRIAKGERWHVVGSVVQHHDCNDPELDKNVTPPHPRLMEEIA
jgi:uncharacterized Zn finger protein (UPF0148 family)